MNFCRQCSVFINSNDTTCPLCGHDTVFLEPPSNRAYPNVTHKILRNIFYKIFLFLSIAISSVSIFINLYTSTKTMWSLIVVMSILYGWSIYFYNIRRYKNRGQSLLMQTICICLEVLAIDLAVDFTKWSTTYVMPFVILVSCILGVILILRKPLKIYEYMIYEIGLIILGFIPLILFWCGLAHSSWPGLTCFIGTCLCILAIFLFADRDAIREIQSRLHH